jgi:hypothetical protein
MATEDEDYEDITEQFLKNNPELRDPQPEPNPEPNPEPQPEPDPKPAPEPAKDEPKDGPAPEDGPEDDKNKGEEWQKSEVFSDMDKMSHGFRKRIEKLQAKHQQEMKELEDKYEARLKAVEERTAPKPEVLGRDAFEKDEDYMAYLVKQELEKDKAASKAAEAEASSKTAEAERIRQEQEADIQRRQEVFRKNTDNSFDAEGKARFMSQVQYAMQKGFGDILDNNPAASDYLLGNRMGPKVLSHILNNPEEFRDVFMSQGQSQMDQYYTLKQIEGKVLAEGRGEVEPQPEMRTKGVRLGKPGGQGASSAGFTNHDDPKARRAYLEKLGVC